MVGAAYDLVGLSFSGFFGFLWFGVIYYLVSCLVCVIIVLGDLLVGCRCASFVCVDLIVCRFVLVAAGGFGLLGCFAIVYDLVTGFCSWSSSCLFWVLRLRFG